MKKVMVEMSGGVDSSTAAAILIDRGFDVCGVTFCTTPGTTGGKSARDAELVADRLRIPHQTVDLSDIFERAVIRDFISEYKSGRTPNPCAVCNRHIKFGTPLFKIAAELGCEYIATGHYAVTDGGELRRGADARKDQSYFLYPILAAPIEKILFPLGAMTKSETRALARKLNIPTADRGESQDICFVPGTDYARFLRSRGVGAAAISGNIVDTDGNILGTHTGIHNYTVGQRKGLGALGKPMYVKHIIPAENTVVVAEDSQIISNEAEIEDVVVSKAKGINVNGRYAAQIRYKSSPVGATVVEVAGCINRGGGINNDAGTAGGVAIRIKFDEPVRAVSPGQAAVLYDGDTVVAGGTIRR
jgi:tRNA-specific 2-thiouridylase